MLRILSLVVTSEPTDAPALCAAAEIARREGAYLNVTCLGVEPAPLEAAPLASAQAVVELERAWTRSEPEVLAAWVRRQLPPGLRATVKPMTAAEPDLAARAARLARFSDLAVMARPFGPGHDPLAPALAEGLLLGTRGPVLVVPDHDLTDWHHPFRRLCLAWNDSDEALHAARAALPFLRQAERVKIAVVDPPRDAPDRGDPGGALGDWLWRHGIKADIAVLARNQPRISDILADYALDWGCEALVMGAFGHLRLREVPSGGITRDMLASVPLPLIMAH